MAILEQGLIGTFTGKMGAIVVAKWKNVYVGKSKPKKSNRPGTETQLQQRAKFALVGKFLKAYPKLITTGFKGTTGTTSMNEAMKYNINHAITGEYPDYKLDYAKVMFSDPQGRGLIDGAFEPTAVAVAGGRIQLSWKPEALSQDDTQPTDILYAVFYSVQSRLFAKAEILRSKLTQEIRLSRLFKGEVHGWIFFASANKKFASPTDYLGKLTVID